MSAPAPYLCLRVEGERIGLPVDRAREIFEPEAVTRVPGAGRAFAGVVNLRGAVVPVVDLATALELVPRPTGAARSVVLVETEAAGDRTLVGLAVDRPDEVVELTPEEIGTTPAFGAGIASRYLSGVAGSGASFVLLLDVDRVLADVGVPTAARGAAALGSAQRPALNN
jgi:purine-binding chemotaxis protein CheW